MVAAGLPDFGPVQNNISFNDAIGTTRGIHAEPWDKWVSVATGRIFGAWVDLREGPSFGTVFTAEIDPHRRSSYPAGVGNAYQTLEPDTAYVYLVNDHWSADAEYSFLNLADETAAIQWPIPLSEVEISAKDHAHPRLAEVTPIPAKKTLIVGAGGQLGHALRAHFGEAAEYEYVGRDELDLSDGSFPSARRWRDYATIINAAAYTAVDKAETAEGRADAWPRTSRRRGSGEDRRRQRHHARARLERLRVRRHQGRRVHRDRLRPPSRRVRPDQSCRRRSRLHCPAPLHHPHILGDRRREQLRADHGLARRARHRPSRRGRSGGTTDVHHRSRRRDRAPDRRRCRARHLQPQQHGRAAVLGRHRPRGVLGGRT